MTILNICIQLPKAKIIIWKVCNECRFKLQFLHLPMILQQYWKPNIYALGKDIGSSGVPPKDQIVLWILLSAPIKKILNFYILLLCTNLYQFFPVSIQLKQNFGNRMETDGDLVVTLICLQSGSVHLVFPHLKSVIFTSRCYY